MKIPNPINKATTQTNLTNGSDGSVVTQTSQSGSSVQSTPAVEQQIEALVPGQTLQGEVVSKNGIEITLKVAGDILLTARMERELNIELGKLLTFQVKNNGKVLSLSPLFANMAVEKTAYKALDMANIPITERNLEMATTMMQRGMNIDASSIQDVYKDVVLFEPASVQHIIRLHQMNVPVETETLLSLISYENMEHQLSLGIEQVISDLYAEGFKGQFLGQILHAIGGQEMSDFVPLNMALSTSEMESLADQIKSIEILFEPGDSILEFIEQPLNSNISVKEMLSFLSNLSSMPKESLIDSLTTLGNEQVVNEARTEDSFGIDIGRALIEDDLTFKLLKTEILNSWNLSPEDVVDKQKVLDTYERIAKQLESLRQLLEGTEGKKQSALKSVANLQNNLNFMHHLNQMYTYIQIPLLMNGKVAQGELYVYTNKKNLAKEDGNVSALLHLDMENLGPVDVYVMMQNQKVSTNFYLSTDELLDFIHEHIHILDEHLAKRGYSLNCKMMLREGKEDGKLGMNLMEQIAKEDSSKMIFSQYSFDVRA